MKICTILLIVGTSSPWLPLVSQEISFESYEPRSTLVVPAHPVSRARFPFIDVHAHPDGRMPPDSLDQLIRDMDGLNMAVMVNLSGRSGDRLREIVENMKGRYPGVVSWFFPT